MNHAIFLRQAVVPPHRQHGHGGHAGQVLQHLRARCQQRRITPELVQHEASDAQSIGFGQQRPGAVEVRKGPAAVDVGDQQAGGVAVPGHAQVHDVAVGQVDLGG
jgi:hypothetical protein